MLLLLNEHGDPSFLFQNLSSYNINNQYAKFDKNPSVGSISVYGKCWPEVVAVRNERGERSYNSLLRLEQAR